MKNNKTEDAGYEAGKRLQRKDKLSAGIIQTEPAEEEQAEAATVDSQGIEKPKMAISQDAITRREIY